MKIVVIGGSSCSTPALFAALPERSLPDAQFVLIGRSAERLAAVARAVGLLAGSHDRNLSTRVGRPDDCGDALADANVVVLQIRVGGMPGRAYDEAFPLEFELCGDEGLSAGGLSAAWRSWPVIQQWLGAVARRAPRALVLMVSSPVGILTRAAHARFPDLACYGVCEVPFVCLRDICAVVGANFEGVRFDYLGVNHLGWLYAIKSGRRDLVAEWAGFATRSGFPRPSLIAEWGGVPTKYLRLQFETAAVLAEQRAAPEPRAHALERLQKRAFVDYQEGALGDIHRALGVRDTPWYSDSIAPLLLALDAGSSRTGTGPGAGPFFLSAPNRGFTEVCEFDDILEMPYRVEGHALERLPATAPAPAAIGRFVDEICRYESLATAAVLARSAPMIEAALSRHPWVRLRASDAPGLVPSLANRIVAGNVA